ncbi:toxin-antitoxin system YwqK family antitoxin [Roseivirga sp. BDSF3-8]|uniref:toxin-antitoxin system YwqK family antitoxin n=1 Tax=Roseivirga sp. BDSF3-8 TaxID=3241598 RepID=UPI003531F1BC
MNSLVRLPLFFGLLTVAGVCYAQTKQKSEYFDARKQHLKATFYLHDDDGTVLHGPYTSYYFSGGKESEGMFVEGEPTGIWSYYWENGHLKMKGELKNQSNFGLWKYYYENGQPQKEGYIYDGLRQDEWKYYYESGGLKSNGKYLDNTRVGIWNYYYEDGFLKAQAFYENGVGTYREFYTSGKLKAEGLNRDGVSDSLWTFYYDEGTIKARGEYEDGVKTGTWSYYYPNGNPSAEGEYTKGEAEGKWTYYHENGVMSSEGMQADGLKEGFWKIYAETGKPMGEGLFVKGEGEYKEFYPSGKLKVKGRIVDETNQGRWEYYYEDGSLEGEVDYIDGEGWYTGYYPDGTRYMTGRIKDNKRVGTWELYSADGSLAGYYRPIYENDKPVFKLVESATENTGDNGPGYSRPEYRYRNRKLKYFTPRIGEFRGFVLAANPIATAFGDLPVYAEYYMQERLGYEAVLTLIRNPFFEGDATIDLNEVYTRGFSVTFRQKFYQQDRSIGMLYFGQGLRFVSQKHQVNTDPLSTGEGVRLLKAVERRGEYSLFIGDRIVKEAGNSGITIDIWAGLGLGYRYFNKQYDEGIGEDRLFDEISQSPFAIYPRLGINVGYIFNFKTK